jgi:hypothetical protein
MTARFILDCTCGKRHTVEPRQAGSQMLCDCGRTLEVPTLRGLRALPQAEADLEGSTAVWTMRQAVVTAGVLISLILLGVGLWNWRQEREIQTQRGRLEFTADTIADMDKSVVENLERMTPFQMWQAWEYLFKPTTRMGFVDVNAPAKAALDDAIRFKRRERWIWLGAAAAVLVGVSLWAALAPSRRSAA